MQNAIEILPYRRLGLDAIYLLVCTILSARLVGIWSLGLFAVGLGCLWVFRRAPLQRIFINGDEIEWIEGTKIKKGCIKNRAHGRIWVRFLVYDTRLLTFKTLFIWRFMVTDGDFCQLKRAAF